MTVKMKQQAAGFYRLIKGFKMINSYCRIFTILILLCSSTTLKAELTVLSYHNVIGHKDESNTGAMVITSQQLAEQFSWLKVNGYSVISTDELIAANEGRKILPKKSVMLSFDDGYQGMYQQVFPLLKLFNYPAVLALVGSWLDKPENESVKYGRSLISRNYFLNWDQIREMEKSGLVELASHSFNLHQGVLANPQGNTQPSATTHIYNKERKEYEANEDYRARIYKDLSRNQALIKRETGITPRIIVWPYGAYNQVTQNIAKQLGMPITMSLDEGHPDIDNLSNMPRILVGNFSDISNFSWLINDHIKQTIDPVRVIHVDLDYIYDKDVLQQEKNLDALLDRVKRMGINTVYLQAFSDPDGDGNANSLYFPNRHLPVRADIFNRVAWQLRTRTDVHVYAWMPVLAFDLPKDHPLASHRVTSSPKRLKEDYRRLSPFSSEALKFVGDIYEDLAIHSKFQGIIFHDDAYLSDYEDNSYWALAAYKKSGLPSNINTIRKDPALFKQWTLLKTKALAQWTDALTERARPYLGNIKTARNIYASVIMNPESTAWFAQSMDIFLKHYDYTAIMAMPYMERAKNPDEWLKRLVKHVAKIPGALDKSVFELQSVNWHKKEPIPAETIAHHMNILLQNGVKHFGYYPDDFIKGLPELEIIRPAISLSSAPEE